MKVEMRLKDWVLRNNFTSSGLQGDAQEMVYIGICAPNEILLGWGFVSVYQKCYTALFLICLVIVGILYGMIYHFIGMRRCGALLFVLMDDYMEGICVRTRVRASVRACVHACVCVCAVSYTHLTLPTMAVV